MTKRALCLLSLLAASIAVTGCGADTGDDTEDELAQEDVDITEQGVTVGAKNYVCAETLTLRGSPGGGVIGTMYSTHYGTSFFTVHSLSGSWAYGYSHDLHRWGWAMAHYLTTEYKLHGNSPNPPFGFSCRQGGQWIGGGAA